MKIAICDDKIDQLKIITAAAERYLAAHRNVFAEIDLYQNAFDFLDAQKASCYDLSILDICMPGILGIDVAKEIRQRGDKTEIIFLTTSNDFAVDAFGVRATHYLLKPLAEAAFDEAMDRAIQNIDSKNASLICLKCIGGTAETIDKDSIVYIESTLHKQTVYVSGGKTIQASQTLAEILKALEALSNRQFICPYKGFIVNQRAIKTIENDKIVLKTGKAIPIPKRSFRQVKQAYFDYMFERKQ